MKPPSGAAKRKRKKEREQNEAAGRRTLFECGIQAEKRPALNRNFDETPTGPELSVTHEVQLDPSVSLQPESDSNVASQDSQTSPIITDNINESPAIPNGPVATSQERLTELSESSVSTDLLEEQGAILF